MEAARWRAGLTIEEFVAGMQTNREITQRRLREVTLSAADQADLARLANPLHALVMTEEWCGDSVMNLPILAKIAEAAPGMDLRVFIRPDWPDLSAHYAERGIIRILVATWLDADFNEVATWVERSQAAHERIGAWRVTRPDVQAVRDDPTLSDQERRIRLRERLVGFQEEMEVWYAQGLQQATVDEIKALLLEQNTNGQFHANT